MKVPNMIGFLCTLPLFAGGPDGHWLASAGEEGHVALHAVPAVAPAAPAIATTAAHGWLRGHTKGVSGIAWSPHDGHRMATAGLDGVANVWRWDDAFAKGAVTSVLRGHERRVLAVAWSGLDTETVFTAGDDQTVYAWRLRSGSANTKTPAIAPAAAAPAATALAPRAPKRPTPPAGFGGAKKRAKPVSTPASPAPAASSTHAAVSHEISTPRVLATATALGQLTQGAPDATVDAAEPDVLGLLVQAATAATREDADADAALKRAGAAVTTAVQTGGPAASPGSGRPTPAAWAALAHGDVPATLAACQAVEGGAYDLAALALIVAASPASGLEVWRELMEAYASALENLDDPNAAAACWTAIGRADQGVGVLQRAKRFPYAASCERHRCRILSGC